jgi:hypothetical protein
MYPHVTQFETRRQNLEREFPERAARRDRPAQETRKRARLLRGRRAARS